ncbi:hypothetical protein MNBD_GAMMA18-552 [hydrothermal vent metagenome]|uniref:Uncharacterized protein n=1 Tax=hydrothermal vent metagenome TaxID=652676 RepID=A0A3B0ZR55_9ZZZZ
MVRCLVLGELVAVSFDGVLVVGAIMVVVLNQMNMRCCPRHAEKGSDHDK